MTLDTDQSRVVVLTEIGIISRQSAKAAKALV
jgi:hypothetical protein